MDFHKEHTLSIYVHKFAINFFFLVCGLKRLLLDCLPVNEIRSFSGNPCYMSTQYVTTKNVNTLVFLDFDDLSFKTFTRELSLQKREQSSVNSQIRSDQRFPNINKSTLGGNLQVNWFSGNMAIVSRRKIHKTNE